MKALRIVITLLIACVSSISASGTTDNKSLFVNSPYGIEVQTMLNKCIEMQKNGELPGLGAEDDESILFKSDDIDISYLNRIEYPLYLNCIITKQAKKHSYMLSKKLPQSKWSLLIVEPTPQTFINIADYGNWCGPNNTKSDRNYPVKDGVDKVCRYHDLCIRDKGYHKCSCDKDFIRGLTFASASNEHAETYKLMAIATFTIKPCECRHDVCIRLCNLRKCWNECKTISTPGKGGRCF